MNDIGNIRKPKQASSEHTWAIRGIEPETRNAATMAARRSGQTVGAWCNQALREAATVRLKEQIPGPTLEQTLAKLAESLTQQVEATKQQNDVMQARLDALEQHQTQPEGDGGGNLVMRLYGLLLRKAGAR